MKFKLVEKKNPLKKDSPAKFYPSAVNAGRKTLKQVAGDIAGRSSLTRGDIENVLSNFIDQLPTLLADGFSVQLGDFGTMRLSLSGEGAESEKKFDTSTIKPKVIFTPSVDFKKSLENIKYERE